MQAAILPYSAGWAWIQEGLAIFRRQPLPMFFWSLVTSFLIMASYILPLFGQMALIAATPLLTFITLNACRHISAGRPMLMSMWLDPVRSRETRRRLWILGFAYLACCMAGGLLATLPFVGRLSDIIGAEGVVDEEALIAAMSGPMITFTLVYILISMLFWHAPALIGWHRIRLSQALFFSMVACWRNKWAFLTYGISWAAIFFLLQMAATTLAGMGLSPALVQTILTPANIILAAILYSSFYPAYISIFGGNYADGQPPATPPAD